MYYEHWAEDIELEKGEEIEDAIKRVQKEAREELDQLLMLDLNLLEESVKTPIQERINTLEILLFCECDGYEICNACLNKSRRERYGYDIHNINCVCNDCNGWGAEY
jgi:hypothetical protein